jgi:hypothetical protein
VEKESPQMMLRFVTGVLLYSLQVAEMKMFANIMRRFKVIGDSGKILEESQRLELDEQVRLMDERIAAAWS